MSIWPNAYSIIKLFCLSFGNLFAETLSGLEGDVIFKLYFYSADYSSLVCQ